jgi:hypothetical protein
MIFSELLEGGEIVCNGIEVREIWRQEEQCGPSNVDEGCGLWAFVARDVIHDSVVAGDSPDGVVEKAERKGHTEFVYHLVPSFSHTYIF